MVLFEAPDVWKLGVFNADTPRVLTADDALTNALLALDGEALYLPLPAHLDVPAFAAVTLARQVDPGASAALSGAMCASTNPTAWYEELSPWIRGRRLILDRRCYVRSAAAQQEIVTAVHDSSSWLRQLLARPTLELRVHVPGGVRTSARFLVPRARPFWDAGVVWDRVQQDPERYALAVLHEVLAGPLPGDAVLRNSLSLAQSVWAGLSTDLRELVALLWVHDRPIVEQDLRRLNLVAASTLDAALEAGLVESRRGLIAVPSGLQVLRTQESAAAIQGRHERWAHAFEAALDGTDLAAFVLEAHRHYAAIPRVDDAIRLARFGVGILLEMAMRMSVGGQYKDSAEAYRKVEQLLDDSRLAKGDSRARGYVVHYGHYNRYKGKLEPLSATVSGYERSVEAWPGNALFISRHVRALMLDGREDEALERFNAAWKIVRSKQESRKYLVDRTVRRLLTRGFLAHALALVSAVPPGLAAEEPQLDKQLEKGWHTARLWFTGIPALELDKEVFCRVTKSTNGRWIAEVGELRREGLDRVGAFKDGVRAAQFHHRAKAWLRAVAHLSSRRTAFDNAAYRAILGMGPAVVPEILIWIRDGGAGHWDQALADLCGEQPELAAEKVTLSERMRAWVRWGEQKGLVALP